MPHVVFVSNPPALGGAEEHLTRLATNVRRAGWQVTVLLPQRPYLQSMVDRLRAAEVLVPTAAIKTPQDYPLPALAHLLDVPQRRYLTRRLAKLAPDIVHINQPVPESGQLAIQAAARVPNVRIVTTVHLYDSVSSLGFRLGGLRDLITDYHYRTVREISVPTSTAAQTLASQYKHARGKISVTTYAVDLARFDATQGALGAPGLRHHLGLPPDVPLICVPARLTQQKGQTTLLKAWPAIRRCVPRARLVLAGEGPDREALVRLCHLLNLGDSVTLLGQIAPKNMPSLLAACNVIVLPSLYECLPFTILEALAMARPVVASDVNAIPDVVHHEKTGLLVPPRDEKAMATAVCRVLQDPLLASMLANNGRRQVIGRFSDEEQVRQCLAMYRRVLSRPPNGSANDD